MTENRVLPALAGEPGYRCPVDFPPPRGAKLLLLTSDGVTVVGDWVDDSNFVAWSPMPKKTIRRRLGDLEGLSRG